MSGTELLPNLTGLKLDPETKMAPKLSPGKEGKPVKIVTNAFKLTTNEKVAYKYAVMSVQGRRLNPAGGDPGTEEKHSWKDITAKAVRFILFQRMLQENAFNGIRTVFDRMNSFYTIGQKLAEKEGLLQFQYSIEGEAPREYKIEFKEAKDANFNKVKEVDLMNELDPEAIAVKQLCLNLQSEQQDNVVGRGSSQFKTTGGQNLGKNQVLLTGMHSSVRVGSNETGAFDMFVSDVSATIFERGGKIPEILIRILGVDIHKIQMNPGMVRCLLAELKGLKVEFQGDGYKRRLRIDNITVDDVTKTKFMLDGRDISVFDYFTTQRKPPVVLRYRNLPCFETKRAVGPPSFTPVEICTLIPNQHHDKKLSQEIQSRVTQMTVIEPQKRFDQTMNEVRKVAAAENHLMDIKVEVKPIETVGRVIDPPTVQFKAPEKVSLEKKNHFSNPCDFGDNFSKMNQPSSLIKWRVVELCDPLPDPSQKAVHGQVILAVKEILKLGREQGMDIKDPLKVEKIPLPLDPQQRFNKLTLGLKNIKGNVENGLLLVILPQRDKLYNDVKAIGNSVGLITQCVLLSNLTKRDARGFKPLKMMVQNLLKKMNAKLGGINATLHSISVKGLFPDNTMVCGLDVYHPGVGDAQRASIIGVLASYTRDFTKYFSCAKSQPQNKETFTRKEEVEKGLDIIMKDFFLKYKAKNLKFPDNLIFYRDGVSDGQLEKVMTKEVHQILKAMSSLGFQAKIAFITLQKRHPIRLYQFAKDKTGKYIVSNPLPGTVVDKDIVHPNINECYINSHHALKGTAKPAQYKLIVNEIGLDMDRVEKISYYLCYIYQRCYKPISCPAPARYAHLVAEKAAGHLESAMRNGQMRDAQGNLRNIDDIIKTHPDFIEKLVFQ